MFMTVNCNKMAESTHSVLNCKTTLKSLSSAFRRVIAVAIHCMIIEKATVEYS